jgi:hypothetical protein
MEEESRGEGKRRNKERRDEEKRRKRETVNKSIVTWLTKFVRSLIPDSVSPVIKRPWINPFSTTCADNPVM